MMPAHFFRFVFCSLIVGFVSCAGEQQEEIVPTPDIDGRPVPDTVDVTWDVLHQDTLMEGTLFCIEGYLGDVGTYVTQTNGFMYIPLFERRNQRNGFVLKLNAPIGEGRNQVHELPAEFMPEDFKVVCNDSKIVTRGSYVRILAYKTSTTPSSGVVFADLALIESVEHTFQDSIFEKAVPLTEEMMNDTTLASAYCYVEGKLALPELIFSYTTEITLDLKNSSVKSFETMDIPIGTGPGTMNDLPDNYTDADLLIRDFKGNLISPDRKVRIYGTWERFNFDSGAPGKFYPEEIEVIR